MKTSDVLNRAADLIEERGWAVGDGWHDIDDRSPLCIQGALAAAMGQSSGVGYRCPAYWAVAEYLGLSSGLFVWNDNLRFIEGRWVGGSPEAATEFGRAKVIATLRACAVVEQAREEQDAAWATYAGLVTA